MDMKIQGRKFQDKILHFIYGLFKFFFFVSNQNHVMFVCSVWVARRPPGYAFIDFDDRRDAQDAIRELDGM